MNSTKYIIEGLSQLSTNFPMIKLSYQVDDNTDTHFVEVLPKDFFENYDLDFINSQNELILGFIENYPDQSLAFITKDDFFTVDDPVYVKEGSEYQSSNSTVWSGIELREMLNTHQADIRGSFTFEQKTQAKQSEQNNFEFTFESVKKSSHPEHVTNNLPDTPVEANNCLEGDNNYMLAA